MSRFFRAGNLKRLLPILLGTPAFFIAITLALNLAPDPPAVREGRERAALYRAGRITAEEFRNPALFRQRVAEKEGLRIKEREEAWQEESERRRREVDEKERTREWQKETVGWEQEGRPQQTHYDKERRF